MIRVKPGIRSEEIRFQSQHVLFVEGEDGDSIDPGVLRELIDPAVRIEPLGPSYSIKSVAQALFPYHPTYYFLIDRDHHSDDFIDLCWKNFPNPDTHNLLVWRRHEIENYFLEPEYLIQSNFCRGSLDELKQKVLQCANERLFLDAANHVVTSLREELKKTWIQKFKNPADFPDKKASLQKLLNATEFAQHCKDVEQTVSAGEVERRFHECLGSMTGGQNEITFGAGNWLHMIQGKKVFAQIIHSNSFQAKATDGTFVTGREKINAVVKDLLQKDPDIQPADFLALKKLIEKRING